MASIAIDRLLAAFRERWPLHELPNPELLGRALHRATAAEIDAVALVSVGLDDRPPSPSCSPGCVGAGFEVSAGHCPRVGT
jgi:hypothetical protein